MHPIEEKINSIIRFFLYLLFFWFPYSSAVIEISVSVSMVLWFVKRVTIFFKSETVATSLSGRVFNFIKSMKPQGSFLNESIAFFLAVCLISTIFSSNPPQVFRGFLMKTLEWFVIYFLIIEAFVTRRHIMIAIGIFIFTAISTCLDSMIQFHLTHVDFFLGHKITPGGGATAGLKTPNDLGGVLTFVVTFAFSLHFIRTQKKYIRGSILAFFYLSAWSLFITYSRGSWLANIIGIIVCLCLNKRKLRLGFILYVFIIGAGFLMLSKFNIPSPSRLTTTEVQSTTHWRSGLWHDSLGLVKEKPFLGHGINSFMRIFYEYGKSVRGEYYYSPTYAHNCYVQMAVEIGLFGLGFFLWLLFDYFRFIMGHCRKQQGEENLNIMLTGIIAGVSAFLAHSFVDTDLYSLQLSSLFWMMVGLSIAICQLMIRKQSTQTQLIPTG